MLSQCACSSSRTCSSACASAQAPVLRLTTGAAANQPSVLLRLARAGAELLRWLHCRGAEGAARVIIVGRRLRCLRGWLRGGRAVRRLCPRGALRSVHALRINTALACGLCCCCLSLCCLRYTPPQAIKHNRAKFRARSVALLSFVVLGNMVFEKRNTTP